MSRKKIWIIIVLIVVIVGGLIYYLKDKRMLFYPTPYPSILDSGDVYKNIQVNPDWKVYSNEKYNFEFKYPPTWNLSEVTESPILTQLRTSFAFITSPTGHTILFSISLLSKDEWKESTSTRFHKIGENKDYVYVVFTPNGYGIPKGYEIEYKTVLSTFKFTK